jgi:Zn-finger protein
LKRIKCDECGHSFYPGKTTPTGARFELEDGTVINVCRRCLNKANAEAKADIRKAINNAKAEMRKEAKDGNR